MLNTTINELLNVREEQLTLRTLNTVSSVRANEITINGKVLLNFASNDYLALSQHPALKEQAIKAIEIYGIGNPSSRLISGNCGLYDQVETRLAALKETEAALIFPTGFQTNLTVLHALSKINGYFFCDQLAHNSALLGVQLANKYFKRFNHNNIEDLEHLLSKSSKRFSWIVTESVFSMDGDLAPINELILLANKTGSYLYIDEAHATGVFGKNGMGLVYAPGKNTIIMGTFGKGCGSFGAYIACSKQIKEYLINFCSGLIYTTALPPSVLASIDAALVLIPHMVSERKYLLKQAELLRNEINKIGFDTGPSNSHIISLYLKKTELALSLSQYLEENKIYARAIRPPTVPENTARIRLSLSSAHSTSNIEFLLNVLRKWYVSRR